MPIPFNLTIVPSERECLAGEHPTRTFVPINGAELPILLGDKVTDARVVASWPAIPDSLAYGTVWTAWVDSYSGLLEVDLPPALLAGIESDLGKGFPSYLSWHIAERPAIRSVKRGLSSLTLVMRGRLLA